MRVLAITTALFMGLVMWGADQLVILDGGGADNGIVTAMEDPIGPPPPKP